MVPVVIVRPQQPVAPERTSTHTKERESQGAFGGLFPPCSARCCEHARTAGLSSLYRFYRTFDEISICAPNRDALVTVKNVQP